MKVCFVTQTMSVGGSSTVVHDLIKNWTCKTDSLFLVLFFNQFDKRYEDLLKLPNLKIYMLDKKCTIDFSFIASLKKTMREISPDVISSHLTCTFYLKIIGQTNKTILFHTIHAEPSFDMPKLYRIVLKKDIKLGKIRLIGVCKYISKKAIKLYKADCKTINNGFSPIGDCSPLPADEKIHFLFMGRFCNVKNVHSIIKAFNYLKDDKSKFDFRVCGAGSSKEEAKIKKLISESQSTNSIYFEGKINNIEALYKKSDVLILVSKREGLPITVLEALSCGLAFVVNDVGGISEYVKDGINGFYSRDCSPESIAETIKKIIDNKNLLPQFKANSISIAKSNSASKMSKHYLEYMKNVCAKKQIEEL